MNKVKKQKTNKGITLVALVITIIVLLILAVVAIQAITNDGILNYAENAKSEYEFAQEDEEKRLENLVTDIDENVPGGSGEIKEIISKLKIGDKVAYNEEYSETKKSTVDSNFVMKDMEWRILDIEEDGTIELISTQPTTSKLTLSGEDGWLNAETKLNTLCNELYANGTGVTARSLNVDDVDKLAGVLTEADKVACTSSYGSLWRYKYDSSEIKSSKLTGDTWSNYVSTGHTKFKEPGENEINSGNPIESEQKYTHYYYTVSNKITQTTSDGISMAHLITQGLNDSNTAASGEYKDQWLSSRGIYCDDTKASFLVRRIQSDWLNNGNMDHVELWSSYGGANTFDAVVRPVVSISARVFGENVDGVWQVDI